MNSNIYTFAAMRFRKLLSILLALLVFYNTAGYYLTFSVRKAEVKKLLQNFISSKTAKPILLAFTAEQSKFILWEDAKEFKFMGTLYDVIATQHKNGTNYYYCYKDTAESKVMMQLDKHLSNMSGINSKNSGIKEISFSLYDISKFQRLTVPIRIASNLFFTPYLKIQKLHFPGAPVPPPEVC